MGIMSAYLWDQIRRHARCFFTPDACRALESEAILLASYRQALDIRRPVIVIPDDIPSPVIPDKPWKVPFNGTTLTLWNPIPLPDGDGWTVWPDPNHPVWYRHQNGTIIPAWNLHGNLIDLLTLREERQSSQRDRHGRFMATFSPRLKDDLLNVPAFNEAVALLVGAAIGLRQGNSPLMHLDESIKPPMVILSHDCDLLRGNDIWTQSIRAYRAFQPLTKGRGPKLKNLGWMARAALNPEGYYIDNIPRLMAMEKEFGFSSTFYLLNGGGGRFGARSGSAVLRRLIPTIREPWEIGIHYNYDTFLNDARFVAQKTELETIIGHAVISGRAHYLRFDPEKSFPFLAEHGLRVDETVGYSDRIGYRCGIAGCFRTFDPSSGLLSDLYEIPLTIMEAALTAQYPDDPLGAYDSTLAHLAKVGGALGLLYHPDLLDNPEFPEMMGYYRSLLEICRRHNAIGRPARTLAELFAA